jgi:hypothetical protein
MQTKSLYYLCESGEVKIKAEEYRDTFIKLKKALWAVVHGLGCEKASFCDDMMLLRGVVFPGTPPAGWTKPSREGLSRPKRNKENAETLKHFTPFGCYELETHQDLLPLWEWLRCPTGYRYIGPGPGVSGSCRIGNLFDPVQAVWYCGKGPICLILPDVEAERREAIDSGRTVVDGVLNWTPPEGLQRILPEKWDLMAAEHAATKGINP